MESAIRDMIDWEQPFPSEEYAERRAKVRAALEAAGYDGMVVTEPRDYYYLSGHDHIWQYRYAVTGLYFDTASGTFVFFDNTSHKNIISTTPEITDLIYGPRKGSAPEHVSAIAAALLDRGLAKGRIAIQPMSYGLHADLVRAMGGHFKAAGADVIEDDGVIENVRLYKSPREVAVIRRAAALCHEASLTEKRLWPSGHPDYDRRGCAVRQPPQHARPPGVQVRRRGPCGFRCLPASLPRQSEPQFRRGRDRSALA